MVTAKRVVRALTGHPELAAGVLELLSQKVARPWVHHNAQEWRRGDVAGVWVSSERAQHHFPKWGYWYRRRPYGEKCEGFITNRLAALRLVDKALTEDGYILTGPSAEKADAEETRTT